MSKFLSETKSTLMGLMPDSSPISFTHDRAKSCMNEVREAEDQINDLQAFVDEIIRISGSSARLNDYQLARAVKLEVKKYKVRGEQAIFEHAGPEVVGAVVNKHTRELVTFTTNSPQHDGVSFDVSTLRNAGYNETFSVASFDVVARDK